MASFLGIDLVEVERDEVLVKAGKQANKRILQFAHQALVAVFGKDIYISLLYILSLI